MPDIDRLTEIVCIPRKKLLCYHTDADGVTSASLFLRFFKNFKYLAREGPIIDRSFIKLIKTERPSLLVFLDLPVDQEREKITKISRNIDIVIIDHHQIQNNLNSDHILHLNPRFDNNAVSYTHLTLPTKA